MFLFRHFLIIALSVSLSARGQSFVIKKNKRGPSLASAKERCCQLCADVLKKSVITLEHAALGVVGDQTLAPIIFKTVASIQKVCLSMLEDYWEQNKNSFCYKANKNQIEKMNNEFTNLQQSIDSLSFMLRSVPNQKDSSKLQSTSSELHNKLESIESLVRNIRVSMREVHK